MKGSFIDYDMVGTTWVKYTKTVTGYFWTPVKDGITYAEFTKVKKGMTYNQALSITGEAMTLESTYNSPYTQSKSYIWSQETSTTSLNVFMDFNFNKLEYKSFYHGEF
jgi:hypothetical protein